MSDRKVQPITPARMMDNEYACTIHSITAFENTLPEDLLDPAYWASVAKDFKPGDEIWAWSDDGTWYAKYVVLGADRAWAKVHMMSDIALTSADVAMTQAETKGYLIKFNGRYDKYIVLRESDNAKLHKGEETKEGATLWLRQHLQATS